jgi:flavin-dependent dehydrogenase
MPEVLVVGGGVAGAAVAIHLARMGHAVLLLDRTTFPRRKACGEGLFPRGVAALHDLGVLGRLQPAAPLRALRFHVGGVTAEARLGTAARPALGVSRAVLDCALLDAARGAGVQVSLGERAVRLLPRSGVFALETDKRVLTPAFIVAADGLNSGLRRQAGLEPLRTGRRYGVSAHAELPAAADAAVEVHFGAGFEVYLTPVGERSLNVAVLASGRPAAARPRGLAGSVEPALDAVGVAHDGWRFAEAPAGAGTFPVLPSRLWSRNLALAGDAAGFFDGITGEGISLALASAPECALAVHAFLASQGDPAALALYERRRRALGRNSELFGRLTLLLAGHPALAGRAVRGLARRPEAFSRLVAVSNGEAPLRSLRPFDLLALLRG